MKITKNFWDYGQSYFISEVGFEDIMVFRNANSDGQWSKAKINLYDGSFLPENLKLFKKMLNRAAYLAKCLDSEKKVKIN